MKTIRLFCSITVALTLTSVSASAQKPEQDHPVRPTPQQRAERRTNDMDEAVKLDDKQYKKIYKIFLKEENAKENAMGDRGPMGPPPGGMGGRPPQGGGFQGGFGMGGGFPGGSGAGVPPSGMPFLGDFGEQRKPSVGGKEIDSDEYIDAREAKFKKILSTQQYNTWRKLHPDPTGFFFK